MDKESTGATRGEVIQGHLEAQWDRLQEAPAKRRQRRQLGEKSFRKTGRSRASGEKSSLGSSLQDSKDGEIGEKQERSGGSGFLFLYRRVLSQSRD
ncbi:hypothetical protein DUI87_24698 [Hirundo rustica rustica]|uniref:Uncharacterized protein n=1 Tax=Hirundo rustica rustica TaxID=333673 RepID=A0A3M0JCE4_HIRRU|nr:hypothetical protein DUI87_24698 [Hirundo rustica rustica]